MTHIYETTKEYNLSEVEKSALDALLYAISEKRIKPKDANHKVRGYLINSMCCRPGGIVDLDKSHARVFLTYKKFIAEHGRLL
jgi:hypothetical protein